MQSNKYRSNRIFHGFSHSLKRNVNTTKILRAVLKMQCSARMLKHSHTHKNIKQGSEQSTVNWNAATNIQYEKRKAKV